MLNRVVPILTAISLWAVPLAAQTPAPAGEYLREPSPTISGSASSEVKFVPDRATVRISVQTRATTAAN